MVWGQYHWYKKDDFFHLSCTYFDSRFAADFRHLTLFVITFEWKYLKRDWWYLGLDMNWNVKLKTKRFLVACCPNLPTEKIHNQYASGICKLSLIVKFKIWTLIYHQQNIKKLMMWETSYCHSEKSHYFMRNVYILFRL